MNILNDFINSKINKHIIKFIIPESTLQDF
jgi:hypothetical protein